MFPQSVSPSLRQRPQCNVSGKNDTQQIQIAGAFLVVFFTLFSIACAGPVKALQNSSAVSITPAAAAIASGSQLQFAASVSGGSDTSIRWIASSGSISTDGLFTAPTVSTDTDITVTATSAANSAVTGSVAVHVMHGTKVSLTISPSRTAVNSGEPVQFQATVTGTPNTAVTWTASAGTITPQGLFTAPVVTSDTNVVVIAKSVADPRVGASVTLRVLAPASVSVSVSPSSTSVSSGGQVQFTATVSGSANTGVTWTASAGSISTTGLFTAPSVQSSTNVTVTATSAAASSAKASATVVVTPSAPPPLVVQVSPSATTLTSGTSVQFKATVTGSTDQSVTWSAGRGTIDSNGNYSAPTVTSSTSDTVTAVSVANTSSYGTASVTVNPPSQSAGNGYWVSPSGSDANDGSQAHPWATLSKANSSFVLGSAGTVIHVANGSYAGITVSRGGSSNNARLTLQCDSGAASAFAAMGKCIITIIPGGTVGFYVTANYVDVVGFDIGNNSSMRGAIAGGCNSSGGVCTGGNYLRVIGNYIHDLGSAVVGNGITGCPDGGAVQINSNQHGSTGEGGQALRNIIYNFGLNPRPSNCNTAQGVYPGASKYGAVVENNLIIKVPVGGISGSAPCNNVYTNNTIVSTYNGINISPLDMAYCPGGVAGNNTISNNAFFNIGQANIWYVNGPSCSSGHPSLFGANISDGGVPDFSGYGGYTGPQSCDTVSPNPWTHQGGASFFVNYQTNGSGDYHLKAGSAGINSGSTACASGGVTPCVPSTDINGTARPQNSSYDVGAYEYVSQ